MPWIQLKLNTTGANAEDLSDALMEAGSVSITFQDTHDTPAIARGNPPVGGYRRNRPVRC